MSKSFYITTTLPYVNAELHMGHALEFVRADIIARYKKSQGYEVYFNSGTDEHGQKILLKAKEENKDVQDFVNEAFKYFTSQVNSFGISEDIHFIRTTDEKHILAAQAFWNKVNDNGYIYKKDYETKYCTGCEESKTDSELVNGECPVHLGRPLEIIKEENYFFKYSAFQEKLLSLYESRPDFVVPESRLNEMKAFVSQGLSDISISRKKEKMGWGIPVPNDPEQVMYVWFDALTNYIGTLGWPLTEGDFNKFWLNGTPTQYCGKDNTRFQAALWQAMLFAAGVPNSYQIVVDGFITGEGGIKMSKTLGNVVDPKEIAVEYGTDALRFFLSKEVSSFEDSPFTIDRFKDSYNSGLANGLGNLTSRIMKMAETNLSEPVAFVSSPLQGEDPTRERGEGVILDLSKLNLDKQFTDALDGFEINKACDFIWQKISALDRKIQETAPFKLIKTDKEKGMEIIKELVTELRVIALHLSPILSQTSTKILELIKANKSPETPLFIRKD